MGERPKHKNTRIIQLEESTGKYFHNLGLRVAVAIVEHIVRCDHVKIENVCL